MKVLSLILLIFPLLIHASIPGEWEIMDSFGVDEAYKNKKYPASILTVVKREDFDEFKLNEFQVETYIKALPETRSFMHKLIGISNWQIKDHKKTEFLSGTKKIILVKIKGSYLRTEKELVEFEEWHHFYNNTFLQLQVIRNNDQISNDDSVAFNHLQNKWL